MRVIVPGGYYSYDSAGKKIWLDYQYYGTTLENIERVKNLTRNKILYDCKRSTVLPTVENGCITHSYQGTEADTDKIQVILKTPITNSLTELTPVDGVVTLETDGKVLVLPTANAAILPSFNQYVLDSNRLTIAESPFGGLKGSGSPDYAPGTLFCQTDGVYLTDTSGTNSTKTLTAGKLKELSLLTVDTTNHTITEEFIISNDSAGTDVQVIDNCSSAAGWNGAIGTGYVITVVDGQLKVTGTTDSNGRLVIGKTVSANWSTTKFITFDLTSTSGGYVYAKIVTGAGNEHLYSTSRFALSAGVRTHFVLPIEAPQGTTGALPSFAAGTFNSAAVTLIQFGVAGLSSTTAAEYYLDNIIICNGTRAYVEVAVPDNLADSSLILQVHDGSTYQTTGTYKLDSTYSAVSTTSANWILSDGTKFDDVYGSGNGRALFPKGVSAETKAGSSGSITYSANKGTSKRIGFRFDLPPSDGGRTNFNKCRIKSILSYAPDAENDYSASFDFADSTNTSYGLQNLSKPWIALYDPTASLIDFYLFTHRPQSLSFKRDETGTIYSLSLYPGAGAVYHGQIPFSDPTLDTNSNSVPDCLEASVDGSLTKFLENYTMVI